MLFWHAINVLRELEFARGKLVFLAVGYVRALASTRDSLKLCVTTEQCNLQNLVQASTGRQIRPRKMRSSTKFVIAAVFGVLLFVAPIVRCQDDDNDNSDNDTDNDTDNNSDNNNNSSNNNDDDNNDDNDSDSIGMFPAGAAPGCISPWAYLDGASGLSSFADALDSADLDGRLKYRNVSGTILAPTNAAFRNLSQTTGLDLSSDDDQESLLRSVLEYHILFASLPTANLTTLGSASYQTALSLSAQGMNARASATPTQILTRQPAYTYQNVTVIGGPLPAGSMPATAPVGTFRVMGANNTANILYNANIQPFSTCSATIYRIDQVLLPPATLTNLGRTSTSDSDNGEDAEGEAEGDRK